MRGFYDISCVPVVFLGIQVAERIMMALSDKLGRQEAHELLRVHAGSADFVAALRGDAKIAAALADTPGELDRLLDAHTYIGLAPQVVDDLLAEYGVAAE
jgi:adenylosuccinate lyase